MSEQISNQHFLSGVYQAPLIKAIVEMIDRGNRGFVLGKWVAVEQLYLILPEEIKKEVKEDYTEIVTAITNVSRCNDPLTMERNGDVINEVLLRRMPAFEAKIMTSLFDHGYLEKRPRNVPVGSE